jgi:Spy/CpxP family protein refolding chaperone
MKKGGITMDNKVLVKSLLILSAIGLLGFTAPATADWGMGYGHHYGWGNQLPGWHHGGYEGPGFGYWSNLSEEDIQKLEKERLEFFEATQDLRSKIYQKILELRSEIAKENPDTKKAAELQTEISKLKSVLDQKRLNHILKIRKISPDMGMGFGGGYGMMGSWGRGGYGMMRRDMMGRGGYGGGFCPNCPYVNPRGSYGMGPGMRGPGMMGYGDDPYEVFGRRRGQDNC